MKSKTILWFALLLILLSACAPETSTPAPVGPTAQPPTPTLSIDSVVASLTAPTLTRVPTVTPIQGKVILVAPPELGTALAESARAALTELAAASKWTPETRPSLLPADLTPEVKVVVLLQPPADLPTLLAAAPRAQWLVVGDGSLEPKGNLSVIRQREELRAFVAGYLTTLVASDWRSAGLVPNAQLQDAFVNGGRYWCGRCIPMYPPVVLFPLAAVQPAGTPPAAWQSALVALHQKSVVSAVYISPAAYSPDLAKSLFALKLTLVGTQPPPAEVKSRWAATLAFDPVPALRKLWPSLIANKGAQTADASLSWSDVNPDLFSEGKQRLVQETLGRLLDGTVGIFSVAP
jgi:hypothetical protein